ncbi:hypothetical protein WA026_017860 [Henosepilachna vigintioctopunctata]|uniref:Uncharacterized protein n=1 Tax=Henosepilachna vigintioctopunctata TaxID=420089 RepID=A0AAW1TXH9_9CUCU
MESYFGRRDSIGIDEVREDPKWSIRFKHFIKYKRNKFWGYIVFLVTLLVTLSIGLLAVISKSALYSVVFGAQSDLNSYILVLVLILDFWMFTFNAALFYGLKLKNSVLILLWMITMLVNWNIFLYARLIFLADKSSNEGVSKNELYSDMIHLIFIVGIWMLMIAIIWDYWQTISSTTDIPELLDVLQLWNLRPTVAPGTTDV